MRLNREVGKVFRESQVYRIDHYLGKETVRNLLVFRFGNGIFEPHLEPAPHRPRADHGGRVDRRREPRRVLRGDRRARDFLQNHLLQLLSLVAMEPPATFEADALRDEKVKVIRAIGELTPDEIASDVVRGQYGPGWVAGQRSRATARSRRSTPTSETETFVAARLEIDDWRWSGVPFYLRTGKRLPKRATEIAIQFREVPHRLFRDAGRRPRAEPARDPDPAGRGDHAAVRGQGPGPRHRRPLGDHGLHLRLGVLVDSPDAYETLILDALLGDASLFTRADEVEEAWAHRDPDHRRVGRRAAARLPELRGRHLGPRGGRRAAGPRGPGWRRI